MYMQEVLESVCRKRKMANWKEYALLLRDASILIPLDRTVASLQGNRELLLVKRSMLNDYGGVKATGRTTDPNGTLNSRSLSILTLTVFCYSVHIQENVGCSTGSIPIRA